MKIRHKITLWISLTALLAAFSLAAFIFSELLEEPLKLIDRELVFVGNAIFSQAQAVSVVPWSIDETKLPYSPNRYWVQVVDVENRPLYQSALTQFTDIPEGKGGHSRYNVEMVIPPSLVDIGQDEDDEVVFRVRLLHRNINGQILTMRIAQPIEEMEEELTQVIHEALLGLVLCLLLIVVISYYLSGRILKPVVEMTALARNISENSLDQRIDLDKNNDELTSLAVALNHMFDGLQHSFKRQKAFISNGSHELKSPLTRLLLNQEELLQNQDLPPELRVDLDRQLTTMRWMKKLIRNLLSLSQLEQQERLFVEPVDLSVLLADVIEQYHELFAASAIMVQLNIDDGLLLQGDRLQLQRLFINLLDNGIRYNDPDRGRLTITAVRREKECVVDVDNAGLSISPEDRELIFEQFYRVEKSRATAHGGVGLGLTLCKRIVDLHGGRIEVASGSLAGTRLRVILPLS